MVVLVHLPTGSIWIVPDKAIILVKLACLGEGFAVVFFVEHVGRQSGLDVVVLECRFGWVLYLVLLMRHNYLYDHCSLYDYSSSGIWYTFKLVWYALFIAM